MAGRGLVPLLCLSPFQFLPPSFFLAFILPSFGHLPAESVSLASRSVDAIPLQKRLLLSRRFFYVFLVIALEASSSSSRSPSLHSRVNGSTIKKYKMKRESPNASGHPGLPRFKNPPRVDFINANSAKVFIYKWEKQFDIGEMPTESQLSYVLQFWEDGRRLADENKTFEGETYTFSGLTPGTMYTFSDIKANTMYTFSGLTPNTSYHVQALVKVTVGGKTCTADGEEVKAMNFTTICPVPPEPEGLSSTSNSSSSISVNWTAVSYPRRCDLQYWLELWEKRNNSYCHIANHVTKEVYYDIDNLQAYTNYRVRIYAMGGGDDSPKTRWSNVKTLPDKPGKVTSLRTEVANESSLLVTWDNPSDNPRKGELESFKVSWVGQGLTTGWKQQTVGLEKKYLINNLKANTSYTIKVQGKNRGVAEFGDESTVMATTILGVVGLNATVSWLTVSWQTPKIDTGITTFYNVSLRRANSSTDSPQWNKIANITTAQFDGLEAGAKYTAQVRACNNEGCGKTLVGDVWTRPAPPRFLEEEVDLGEPTGSTITIQLPLLANPPGSHYVMVQQDGTGVPQRNLEQNLMNIALALVDSEEKNTTSKSSSVDSPKMYIAAKLQQEDVKRLQVTLGDDKTYEDHYYNKPFEMGAAYWTLVVTEKKSGSWTERVCSVPRRFVAAPNNTSEGLGLAAGMAAMLLVIAALAIVCIKIRARCNAGM
ncbi:protein sidekick-1-like isoform X2 [Eriocheir sinensis]|uniref:protein sidekick-1-like isoform X2 n=1 Tax=Eriocheir sinensis TaxID=95602 RepID=UPI0021C789B2|nr:protein sidekick-1-like isoform X2 [Eriocheir sinensis]